MIHPRLVRDYENDELPIERRVSSLARRFDCLASARGLEPWSAEALHCFALGQPRDSAAWHASHLILNLVGSGPWAKFDIVGALAVLSEKDRRTLATWVISWR
jgi:hypothetical protein